jgi:hypothetical protein
MAEREWKMAEFYDRRSEYGAARFYYDRVVDQFDDTPFSEQARSRIEAIAGEPPVPPQRFEWLVRLFPDPHRDPVIRTTPGHGILR